MSLTFPPINNQATIRITTANNNTLVTLTSPPAIATTTISANTLKSFLALFYGVNSILETQL